MENVKNINLEITNRYKLHEEVYPSHPVKARYKGVDDLSANVSFRFDYEQFPNDKWLFHGDTTLEVERCGWLITRTTFRINCTEAELFSPPILLPLIKESFKTVVGAFKNFAAENDFPVEETIDVNDRFAEKFVQHTIDTYRNRAEDDEANSWAYDMDGMHLTPGGNTSLIVTGTFMILDHLLYENPEFDNEHNRDAFSEMVPLQVYETVKLKCMQIAEKEIQLNWMHTIFFLICTDCALQMLIGEHADKLIERTEKFGMSELRRKEYITFCSEMLEHYKNQMKEGKMTISNLENKIDWNALMS